MTTFATTDPALLRLFERLDFAPQPKDESLDRLLGYWKSRLGNRIAPTPRDIVVADLGDDAASAFVLQLPPRGTAPTLMFGGAAFETLVGSCDPGALVLVDAPQRRGAVRLRRLSELVLSRAEPVLAEFGTRRVDGVDVQAEMLVAPLSSDGRTVDGLFGGVALRHIGAVRVSAAHGHELPGRIREPFLFALSSAADFGERIARHLGCRLQPHEERDFEDGEHKTRPLVDVRDRHVHVVAGLYAGGGQSVNDRLCRLLFFLGALKESGAAHVTVAAPYLCYARKDRQTKPRDPVTTRYVGQLFEAVGTDRLITMEVHNLVAFQNAFRCNTIHLDAYFAFGQQIASTLGQSPVAVVSPDIGGAKRAELFRQTLEAIIGRPVSKGLADKQRSMGRVSGDLFVGDVRDRVAVILDDLISTGATMARVARHCRMHGAREVFVVATHGVGGTASLENLTQPDIDRVMLANTVPQAPEFVSALGDRLDIVDVSGVFARAISP